MSADNNSEFGYGDEADLLDSDGDTEPDIWDNCPYVSNIAQRDADNDGVGDLCDDCPFTYDPEQALTDAGGGGGPACDCSLPGVLLGGNGCPCTDGGAAFDRDAGDVCRLIVAADGGLVPYP
jgi:hypothetical protein